MSIKIEVSRDEEGYTNHATLYEREKKILEAFYDKDSLFTIDGSRRNLTPENIDILKLVFSAAPKTKISIPQPLAVENVIGGGRTVLYDDMEALLKWSQGDGTVALDNTFAYNGSQSLKVTCGVADVEGRANRTIALHKGIIDLGCVWSIDNFAKLNYLTFELTFDQDLLTVCSAYYQPSTRTWFINNAAGGLTAVFTETRALEVHTDVGGAWHRFGLKVNLLTREFIELRSNFKRVRLGTHVPPVTASGTNQEVNLALVVEHAAGQAVNGWFDDVIVSEE